MSEEQKDQKVEEIKVETPTEAVPEKNKEPAEKAEETQPEIPAEEEKTKKIIGAEEVKPGMIVRVHEIIKDVTPKGEERKRVQIFEGTVLGLRGAGVSRTMTVRKVSDGHGVEKIYPINSPVIEKIEVIKIQKVRRAKLNFLKNLKNPWRKKFKVKE